MNANTKEHTGKELLNMSVAYDKIVAKELQMIRKNLEQLNSSILKISNTLGKTEEPTTIDDLIKDIPYAKDWKKVVNERSDQNERDKKEV